MTLIPYQMRIGLQPKTAAIIHADDASLATWPDRSEP